MQRDSSDMVSVEKDSKGGAWIVSHIRCGYHECIWLSQEELRELREELDRLDNTGA